MRNLVRHSGLFAASLLCLQGTIYLLQLLAAANASAEDYVHVRLIDSYAAVGALLISCGLPSAALVAIAAARGKRHRQLLMLTALTACAVVALAFGIALFALPALRAGIAVETQDSDAVFALALLMALRLILMAAAQAQRAFTLLAWVGLLASTTSLASYALLMSIGANSVLSWMIARVLIELTACAALAPQALRLPRHADGLAVYRLVPRMLAPMLMVATPLGASLAMRSVVEHGPLFWLAAVGAPVETIAAFGVVLTLGLLALAPASVVTGVLTTHVAGNSINLARQPNVASIPFLLAFGTGSAMVLLLITAPRLFASAPVPTVLVVAVASSIVGCKTIAGVLGGYLLAKRRVGAIFGLNTATLLIGASAVGGLLFASGRAPTLEQALLLVLLVEAVAAAFYVITALRQFSRSPSSAQYVCWSGVKETSEGARTRP